MGPSVYESLRVLAWVRSVHPSDPEDLRINFGGFSLHSRYDAYTEPERRALGSMVVNLVFNLVEVHGFERWRFPEFVFDFYRKQIGEECRMPTPEAGSGGLFDD